MGHGIGSLSDGLAGLVGTGSKGSRPNGEGISVWVLADLVLGPGGLVICLFGLGMRDWQKQARGIWVLDRNGIGVSG